MDNKRSAKPLGFWDYTVIATYLGMICAAAGIFAALKEKYIFAAIFLMLAGGFDMVDGAIASTRKRTRAEKNFGIQIDSLCDLISFGVLPGMFTLQVLGRTPFAEITATVYILAALIRLAYFNVLEAERQLQTEGKREQYLGIPVTTVSVVLPLFTILFEAGVFKTGVAFAVMLYVLAVGFLAPLTIKKPGNKGKIVFAAVGVVELIALIVL